MLKETPTASFASLPIAKTGFGIMEHCHKEDWTTFWHKHDFLEVAFVLQGEGYHLTENSRRPLKKGCVYFIPPNKSHRYIISSEIRVFNLFLQSDFLSRTYKQISNIEEATQLFSKLGFQYLNDTLLYLDYNEVFLKQAPYMRGREILRELLNAKESALMTHLKILEFFSLLTNSPLEGVEKKQPQAICQLLQWISLNYEKDISLAQAAERVEKHPSHLSRLFKQSTGYTFSEYLYEYRLNRVNELLSESDLSISEIATNCGFTNLSFFNRIYKRTFGTTPIKFRRQL